MEIYLFFFILSNFFNIMIYKIVVIMNNIKNTTAIITKPQKTAVSSPTNLGYLKISIAIDLWSKKFRYIVCDKVYMDTQTKVRMDIAKSTQKVIQKSC